MGFISSASSSSSFSLLKYHLGNVILDLVSCICNSDKIWGHPLIELFLQNYIYKLPARRTRESVSGVSLSGHQPAWNALDQNQLTWRQNSGTVVYTNCWTYRIFSHTHWKVATDQWWCCQNLASHHIVWLFLRCRCGSKTDEQSGARRRRRGVNRQLWLSMVCTAPWYDTRYLYQTSLSSQPRTASKVLAHLGCLVSYTHFVFSDSRSVWIIQSTRTRTLLIVRDVYTFPRQYI